MHYPPYHAEPHLQVSLGHPIHWSGSLSGPLWLDAAARTYPVLSGDASADLAIVGGGFSGLGAAFALRETGADVVLLESRLLAGGASGRNAGFVLAGPATSFTEVSGRHGPKEAGQVWALTEENNRLLAKLVETHTIDCGYLRRGSLSLAASGREMSILRAQWRDLIQAGIGVALVERRDLPSPFGERYEGGLYYSGNAELNPAAFIRGIAAVIAPHVRIHERSPVLDIDVDSRYVLITPHGRVSARSVVLATNAYTPALLPHIPIQPARGQVLATEPVEAATVPFPMYANYGYQYWRQTPEGRIVVGGWRDVDRSSEVGQEERLNPHLQALLQEFCSFITGGAPAVEYRWAGIMGFTPDRMPLVGPVPRLARLYVAAGYSGHGVSMAFTCGVRAGLRALELEAPDIPASFDPARFGYGFHLTDEPGTRQDDSWRTRV